MKLAILVGASNQTLESPLVPLSQGLHRFHVLGLHDSIYDLVLDDNTVTRFSSKLVIDIGKDKQNIKLRQVTKGTEHTGSISIFSELIPEGEKEKDGFIPL